MAKKDMQVNKIKIMIGVSLLFPGLLSIVAGHLMWKNWIRDGTTEKNESQGKVYQVNDHGRIVYFDLKQRVLSSGLPVVTFVLGGIIWVLSSKYLDRKERKSISG